MYIWETSICPWKQSPFFEECGREGKILNSGMMGQYQVANPYQESMGRGGKQESSLGSVWKNSAGQASAKGHQDSVCLSLTWKELVRNLLRNNCFQKRKTGAEKAEEFQKQHGKAGAKKKVWECTSFCRREMALHLNANAM